MPFSLATRRIAGGNSLPVAGKRLWLGLDAERDGDARSSYQLFRTDADGRVLSAAGAEGGGDVVLPPGKHRLFVRGGDNDSLAERACRDLAAAQGTAPKAYLILDGTEEKGRIAFQVKKGLALVADLEAAGLAKDLLKAADEAKAKT